MAGWRNSKIWRYRYVLYLVAIAYYGYQAYQRYSQGSADQPKAPSHQGESITLPNGQKAKLYDVDAFMELHGAKPAKGSAKKAQIKVQDDPKGQEGQKAQ